MGRMSKKEPKEFKPRKIAVIRVRGRVHVRKEIEDTLKLLNLNKVNHCVIIDNRPQYMGMLNKVKDYVTWGEINKETLVELIAKRGRVSGNRKLDVDYIKRSTPYKSVKNFVKSFIDFRSELGDITLKPVFRLKPPSKGYERKGIKVPCSLGGALGYRGEKINDLLLKMI